MDFSKIFTKRNIIIATIAFALLVLIIWIITINNSAQTREISYTRMAFQYPLATGTRDSDKAIVFSNGRAFVAYNPNSGEVNSLTNEVTLPTIGTILMRPDGKGALFQTVSNTFDDNLAPILNDRSLNLDEPYWWYVDFNNSSYQLVTNPQNNQPAKFKQVAWVDNNSFVGTTSLTTQTQVDIYQDLQTIRLQYIVSKVINSFAVRDGKITYQADSQIFQSDLDQNSPTELLNNVSSAVISPTNNWAFVYEPIANSDKSNTYIYNLVTKQKMPQSQSQEKYVNWSNDGSTIFATYQGGSDLAIKSVDVNTKKETLYKSPDLKLNLQYVTYAQNPSLFIATDFGYNLYLASDNQNANKFKIPDNFKTITKDNTTIEYFATEGYFIATTFGPNTQETRKMIADQLRANGVTPELVQINYIWQEDVRDGPRD